MNSSSASPAVIITAGRGSLLGGLRELWDSRELLGFLAWRDIRVRYSQTLIGVAWALLEPLIGVLIFTLIFHRVAGFEPTSAPYPLYCLSALIVWSFFGRAMRDISVSFVANATLLRKIYFPRLVLPLAVVGASLVDFGCAAVMYLGMLVAYGVAPTWTLALLPVWLALAGVVVLGVGLALAALNVWFRDVTQALPFLIQVWMFATPVVYPLDAIPSKWQAIYRLNPMVGVIEGARWSLLPDYAFDPSLLISTVVVGAALLALGLFGYQRAERGLADVI
ncbi:MAG: ABC transporter permease [Planctomycetota bacterium]|nr:MAG: ABC transporter permease [Planctomycetota bacterium]